MHKYFHILEKLNNEGYEAYIVGGAIRDIKLNKKVRDIDITTSRLPKEIKEVFRDYKTIDIGSEYGTIVVVYEGEPIDITTFRLEKDYDGRRPRHVEFSRNLLDDLKRRDFTINQLIMDSEGNIFDYFGGLKDLEGKVIKAIGNPHERLQEDYLRILRAIRFACQLDFSIDEDLMKAIIEKKEGLRSISIERINEEFSEIMVSDNPKYGLNLLMDTGIIDVILPEISPMKDFNQRTPYHSMDLWNHTLEVVANVDSDLELRLAALFHDIGKLYTQEIDEFGIAHYYNHARVSRDVTEKILKRLRYSKKTIGHVLDLVNMHMDSMNPYTKKRVKRLLHRYKEEGVRKLFKLHKSDMDSVGIKKEGAYNNLNLAEAYLDEIIENEEAVDKDSIDINGQDIIDLGFKEGKIIGIIIDNVTERILDEKLENKKSEILEYIKGRYLNET